MPEAHDGPINPDKNRSMQIIREAARQLSLCGEMMQSTYESDVEYVVTLLNFGDLILRHLSYQGFYRHITHRDNMTGLVRENYPVVTPIDLSHRVRCSTNGSNYRKTIVADRCMSSSPGWDCGSVSPGADMPGSSVWDAQSIHNSI
jgi:hypothetical protein